MKGRANLIREFIGKTDWATAENVAYLIFGKCDPELKNDADWALTKLTKLKSSDKKLKLLPNEYQKIYALWDNPKHRKGDRNLNHDIKLRNVLAVLKPDQISISNYEGADAVIETKGDKFFIELDNGNEDREFLENKIKSQYGGKGEYQVIFIMASREGEKEKTRLENLWKIIESSLKYKKGRVLGACYSQFLQDQKLNNWKGKL